jgi:hypothetical protein
VDSLEDGAFVADVTGGGQTETTDQTGAHVGKDIAIQVRHDEDLVVVGSRVGSDLQARVVQQLSVELDIGEVLGNFTGGVQEKTVGHLHDGGLVHDPDLLLVDRARVLEGEAEHPLGGLLGDQLDALHDTVDDDVLDAGVFTLGVLTDQHGIDIVVGSLEARDRPARTQVGEEVEGAAKGKVQGDVSLSDRRLEMGLAMRFATGAGTTTYGKRALERDVVPPDTLNSVIGNRGLSILQDRRDINGFPLDRRLQAT